MRLILVLLVLIFVSTIINAEHCKQLCSDKKTCCSAPLNNEYHLKSIECNGKKTSCGFDCLKMDSLFATSDHFGCGSVITICKVGSKYTDVDIVKASGSGSGSGSGTSGGSGGSNSGGTSSNGGGSTGGSGGSTGSGTSSNGGASSGSSGTSGSSGSTSSNSGVSTSSNSGSGSTSSNSGGSTSSNSGGSTSLNTGSGSSGASTSSNSGSGSTSSNSGASTSSNSGGSTSSNSGSNSGSSTSSNSESSNTNGSGSNNSGGSPSSTSTTTNNLSSITMSSLMSSLSHSSAYAAMTADAGLAVSSTEDSLSSDMSSIMGSMSSGDGDGDGDDDDDDDGASLKRRGKRAYRGGHGSASTIYGKCIKVTTIDSNESSSLSTTSKANKVIGVSKQICIDLFGSESCDEQSTMIAVQSTKNDGFSNEGTFPITHEEYMNIIKHGQILREQCRLKGKCLFTK